MIVLLVMTDGRKDCIAQTIPAARQHLGNAIARRVIHDDSGDPHYQHWLAHEFPDFELIRTPARSGFGRAIGNAWTYLTRTAEADDCRFVFHLEDDFILRDRPLDLRYMADILDERSYLQQLALRRQPWNDDERVAGGIIEQHPDAYTEHHQGPFRWLEHRLFFTTNPSLYRRSLCWSGWPDVRHSEGIFTHRLLEDPAVRFGFWGPRDSGEWCEHIGHERAGTGY